MSRLERLSSSGNYRLSSVRRANLPCQACHAVERHRIAGSGVDLRVSDLDVEMRCARCHVSKETSTGHATAAVNTHVARVACQTCHIPRYARNASDTNATEETETHRTWRSTHATAPPYHPAATRAARQGLVNMGYTTNEPYTWVTTDAYQLLAHTVAPKARALACTACHENTSQLDLPALGYAKKAEMGVLCRQCHEMRGYGGFATNHDVHVTKWRFDCSWCHEFSRPERALVLPR